MDFGFRAIVSTHIADIFISNASKNGLLPVIVKPETHDWLIEHGGEFLEINLEKRTLTMADGNIVEFPIEPFARTCLLNGVDPLGFLLQQDADIEAYEIVFYDDMV